MATISIDSDMLIDQFDTDELIDELRDRASHGDKEAIAVVGGGGEVLGLNSWDSESLICAVRADDGRRALDLLRGVLR